MNAPSLPPLDSDRESASMPEPEPVTTGGHARRDPASVIRLGWMLLLFGFVGFLGWAALAPLDSGVTAAGEIVVDSQRQKVQHLTGGIVESIMVRDGDHVQRDDVLVRLNRTRTQSELSIVRAQLLSSLAVEARLLAERNRGGSLDFPPRVVEAMDDPRVREVILTQRELFRTRRSALENELSILDETARGLDEQIKGLRAQVAAKERQSALLREELASLQLLFEQGYVPRVRIFELERAISETDGRRSDDLSGIARAQAALGEMRLRKIQREQEYSKEIETQLTSVQREVDGLEQRRIAVSEELERVDIRAPVSGVVVGMRIHSTGAVLRPGEDILELVPDGEPLVVEARVATQSIELVKVGLHAMVRLTALSRLNPVVEGRVVTISADRLTEERSGLPYFKVRVEIPVEELARLDYVSLVPGMPAEIVIKTGEHSVLHYLLKPFLDHVFSAFRER